jgi:hypothetical protein
MDLSSPFFDFVWEEIKVISENPLKSGGYAPYLMHMIESDSWDILLRKEVSLLTDQEWFESSSWGVKSSGTTFFAS